MKLYQATANQTLFTHAPQDPKVTPIKTKKVESEEILFLPRNIIGPRGVTQGLGIKKCFNTDSEKSFQKYFMSCKITITHQVVLSSSASSKHNTKTFHVQTRGDWSEKSMCKECVPFTLGPRQSQIPSCPGTEDFMILIHSGAMKKPGSTRS